MTLVTRALWSVSVCAMVLQALAASDSSSPSAPADAAGQTALGAEDDCRALDTTSKCFQERVKFFEGLILFGVLLMALLCGLTCIAALNTPTKFQTPKERND